MAYTQGVLQKNSTVMHLVNRKLRKQAIIQSLFTHMCIALCWSLHLVETNTFSFIDDCTRTCRLYFMKHKYEVFGIFKKLKAMVELQSGCQIKKLKSDRGGEYTSIDFINCVKMLDQKGSLQWHIPSTKQCCREKEQNH